MPLYLVKKTNVKPEMAERPPFGPGAPPEIVERAAYMEVWGTSFTFDDVPDYTEFRLFDEAETLIWKGCVDGY